MKIRTILAAAAVPATLAAALLGSVGQASAAVQPPASAPSAYFWQPNGHALTGPQQMTGGSVSFNSGNLATVTEKLNNTNIFGKTITIQGTLTNKASLITQLIGGNPQNPTARVYFQGAGAGTNANSPNGYEGQQWWADAKVDLNTTPDTFTLTAKVDPAATSWTDWNGQSASANPDLFHAAASHAQNLGLSFGGNSFFEDGVTGNGSLHIDSIQFS
jgi:hypothetical protein